MKKLSDGLWLLLYRLPLASSSGDFWQGVIAELVSVAWLGLGGLIRQGRGRWPHKGVRMTTMDWFLATMFGMPLSLFALHFWGVLFKKGMGRVILLIEGRRQRGKCRASGAVPTSLPSPSGDVRYQAALNAALRITGWVGVAAGKANAILISKITYLLLDVLYDTERRLDSVVQPGGRPPGGKR